MLGFKLKKMDAESKRLDAMRGISAFSFFLSLITTTLALGVLMAKGFHWFSFWSQSQHITYHPFNGKLPFKKKGIRAFLNLI